MTADSTKLNASVALRSALAAPSLTRVVVHDAPSSCVAQMTDCDALWASVECTLHPERGLHDLTQRLATAVAKHDPKSGDIVVVCAKLIAIARGRLFPLELLQANKAFDLRGPAAAGR